MSWSAKRDEATLGELCKKSTSSCINASEGWRMTRPELSKCDVRGPSSEGMGGESSVVFLSCMERLQLAGILHPFSAQNLGPESKGTMSRSGTYQSSG